MDRLELTRLDALWALVRVLLGVTFLHKAWISAGTATTTYLKAAKGPFQGFFHSLAGQTWTSWPFLIGLAGIGIGLVLGIARRFTAVCAAVLLVLLWTTSLPSRRNPLVDPHLLSALVAVGIGFTTLGWRYGLGRWWSGTPLVQRHPWLA